MPKTVTAMAVASIDKAYGVLTKPGASRRHGEFSVDRDDIILYIFGDRTVT